MSARALLLCGCLLAGAAHAGSYSLGGSLGGGCMFVDEWSRGEHYDSQTFDFETDANVSGTPLRPGLLQFLAGARYRTYRSIYSQGNATAQALGFRTNLIGLSETILPVQLFASREWGDFVSELGKKRTGETISTTFGASTQFMMRGYPSVRLLVLRNILDNKSLGAPSTTAGTTAVSVGAGYATGTQTYNASYDTAWNTGTWAENNYRSHSVMVAATAAPTERTMFRLSERYYLRQPTNDDPRNPRFDDNAFNVGLNRPSPAVNTGFDYGYRRLLVSAHNAPEMEQSSHTLSNSTAVHLNRDTDLLANAGFVANNERLAKMESNGESERVGLGVNWRHTFSPRLSINAGGGGAAGLTEPSTGGLLFGWGANASAGAAGMFGGVRGNATYTITYQRSLAGGRGWMLSQRGSFNAETVLRGVLLNGTFLATGDRRSDPLLGNFVARSLTASLGSAWRRYTASVSAGISDGLADALADPASDGLFLPVAYNTETRFATLTAGGNFDRGRLYVGLILRTLASSGPGRPLQYEHAAALTASYSIGAFVFSLEERFSSGGFGTNSEQGNLVMLRAMRSFSWGF